MGPLVGERVPHDGERAAVERSRSDALWPCPARRGTDGERQLCVSPHGGGRRDQFPTRRHGDDSVR